MTHYVFDRDDVLVNWHQSFVKFLNVKHDIWPDTWGPKTWDLREWIGPDAPGLVLEHNASHYMRNISPCHKACEAVLYLREQGHTASVATAAGTAPKVRRMVRENLEEHFGPNAFGAIEHVGVGQSKRDILLRREGAVYVEDSYDNALIGVELGMITYCIRRTHNMPHWKDSRVRWINNLWELVE